jgi:hypothetical protein
VLVGEQVSIRENSAADRGESVGRDCVVLTAPFESEDPLTGKAANDEAADQIVDIGKACAGVGSRLEGKELGCVASFRCLSTEGRRVSH